MTARKMRSMVRNASWGQGVVAERRRLARRPTASDRHAKANAFRAATVPRSTASGRSAMPYYPE